MPLYRVQVTAVHHTTDSECVSCEVPLKLPPFYVEADTPAQVEEAVRRIVCSFDLQYEHVSLRLDAAEEQPARPTLVLMDEPTGVTPEYDSLLREEFHLYATPPGPEKLKEDRLASCRHVLYILRDGTVVNVSLALSTAKSRERLLTDYPVTKTMTYLGVGKFLRAEP